MAHCKYEMLQDLEAALDEIRVLAGVKEPKPGTFYLKSKGFLHFYYKGERRWADARDGVNWGTEIEIPFKASKPQIQEFLQEVLQRYENSTKK